MGNGNAKSTPTSLSGCARWHADDETGRQKPPPRDSGSRSSSWCGLPACGWLPQRTFIRPIRTKMNESSSVAACRGGPYSTGRWGGRRKPAAGMAAPQSGQRAAAAQFGWPVEFVVRASSWLAPPDRTFIRPIRTKMNKSSSVAAPQRRPTALALAHDAGGRRSTQRFE